MSTHRRIARYIALTVAVSGLPASAQTQLWEVDLGHQITWVQALPDMTSDGVDEIAHGGTYANGGVLSGRTAEQIHDLTVPSYMPSGHAGGDLNGDGLNDLLVGGSLYDGGHVVGYSGARGFAMLFDFVEVEYEFGQSAVIVGDLDGDGYDDIAVGSPYEGGGAGALRVFHTRSGRMMYEELGEEEAHLGRRLVACGDVTSDGIADFAMLHGTDPYLGATLTVYSGADFSRVWRSFIDGGVDLVFGSPFAAAGDFNGDGTPDLVLGQAFESRVLVLSGDDGRRLAQLSATGTFGHAVAGGADFDGDGYDDILVGAPAEDEMGGNAYVFRGGLRPIRTRRDMRRRLLFHFSGDDYIYGNRVAALTDMTGDGRPEFAILSLRIISLYSP
jgi:hypothetical protein